MHCNLLQYPKNKPRAEYAFVLQDYWDKIGERQNTAVHVVRTQPITFVYTQAPE